MLKTLFSKKSLVAVAILPFVFIACTNQGPEKIENEAELKQEAKEAIMTVGGKLKKTLKAKAKEGGLTNAAEFCATEAQALTKEASKGLPKGVSVKRITDKPRNIKNQATPEQLLVLEELKAKKAEGKMPKMLVKKVGDNHYQVYKPLQMGNKCLNCHGDNSTRNEAAYKIISEKFPHDKAINYQKGDFRGAFLVDIIK
jgi:nitrate reductase cytochrome c-type subunit